MTRAPARKTLRQQVAENDRWMKFYAGDKPLPTVPASLAHLSKAKRIVTKKMDDIDRESAVMSEVGSAISLAPSVLLAWRANSGSMRDERGVPIWFYKWVKRGTEMTLSDYICLQRDGRLVALECKWRGWHYTGTPREKQQDAFIQAVRSCGGRGGFVTCASQAIEILSGK